MALTLKNRSQFPHCRPTPPHREIRLIDIRMARYSQLHTPKHCLGPNQVSLFHRWTSTAYKVNLCLDYLYGAFCFGPYKNKYRTCRQQPLNSRVPDDGIARLEMTRIPYSQDIAGHEESSSPGTASGIWLLAAVLSLFFTTTLSLLHFSLSL